MLRTEDGHLLLAEEDYATLDERNFGMPGFSGGPLLRIVHGPGEGLVLGHRP